MRVEAEISRVLVPSGKSRGTRLLDEKGAGIVENVGAVLL